MRAAVIARFGGPGVLGVADVPAPRAPRGNELLVRVRASSVNGTDLGLRRGGMRVATLGRMPFVPGFDVAGEVAALGPRVTAFAVGDRVLGLLGHAGGGQGERVLLPSSGAAHLPDAVSFPDAAALPLAGLTALQALYGVGRLGDRRRPRVLVLGASGGIGAFGVQLAKRAGATVTAVTSAPGVEFARSLGADEVLDRGAADWRGTNERWDLVLDSPAIAVPADADRVLRPRGTLVTTKPISVAAARGLATTRLTARQPRFAAVATRPSTGDLARLVRLVMAGDLRPPVDRVLPLAQIAEAHRLAEGPALGKVVLELPA